MTRLTPDPRILALAESNEPDCGKEFNPGLCRTRHLAAKAREARGLTHGPCAYCPLILKHLGIVTKSADKPENPTCPTCGNELTQNGFCRSCHASDIQAKEAAKRPMCKDCGKRYAKPGFEYCGECLKNVGKLKFKAKKHQEEPKTMPNCKKCDKPCTENPSGLCRACSAAENAKKARAANTGVKREVKRCEKCGKKLTKNGYCYTCAAHEREAKKGKKSLCKKTAPKITQVALDMPGVGTCPNPAADTIHASSAPVDLDRGEIVPTTTHGLVRYKHPESIYRRALRHYGDRNQIFKTAEEASELSAAIMRYMGASDIGLRSSPLLALVEELADVEIMCQQMRLVFGDQPVDAAKRQKLERLERRLEE